MKVSKSSWVVKIQQEDREKFIDMAQAFGYDFRLWSDSMHNRTRETHVWYGYKMVYGDKKIFLTYPHHHTFSKIFHTIDDFINYHMNFK